MSDFIEIWTKGLKCQIEMIGKVIFELAPKWWLRMCMDLGLGASSNFLDLIVFCCYFTASLQISLKSNNIWDQYIVPPPLPKSMHIISHHLGAN